MAEEYTLYMIVNSEGKALSGRGRWGDRRWVSAEDKAKPVIFRGAGAASLSLKEANRHHDVKGARVVECVVSPILT